MEKIIIKKSDGTLVDIESRRTATKITSAKQSITLLGDDIVNISVESPFKQNYQIGDSINVFGREYKLNRLPKVKKGGAHAFGYELEFEGVQYDLMRATYNLTIDTTNNQLQDIQSNALIGDLSRFANVLIANANRVMPGKWVLGDCPETIEDVNLVFGETDNCLSVLQRLCSQFDTEFEIEQVDGVNTIHFRKAGQVFPFVFEYGRGKGLFSLDRQNVSSANIITRLNVYGASKNITNKYRAQRLCLPDKTKGQSFIEKPEPIANYGIWEATKYFEDVYPRRTGKVTALGNSVLKFVDNDMFDLNALEADGITTKYLLPGVSAKIHFNTGNLAGYEFDVHKYDHATKTFTIVQMQDERGSIFPAEGAFQIGVDDEYKLLDVALPESYEIAAENELANKGEEYYNQNSQPKVQYGMSIADSFLRRFVGEGVTVNIFMVGDYIQVKDDDIDVDKSIRIRAFTRDLLNEYNYTLTISDTVQTSITNRVISDIIDIDKVISINNLKDPAQARANWRSSRELLNMIFDPEGDYYSDKIKPESIDTLALSVGAKSMQFGLTNTVLQPNHNGNKNLIKVTGGVLTHYTIDEGGVRSWVLANNETTFNSDTQAYYIYAKCSRTGESGSIIFSTEQIKVEQDANFYHFWVGVVNSVDVDLQARSVALSYGFTMINGRFIKTGRIESADGNTYFDLDNSEIGGRIVFSSNGSDKTLEELGQESLESKDFINNTLPGLLTEIQEQIDGQIEQFFESYDPTISNAPAVDWTTTQLKEEHLGDLFYNTDTGKVWRWVKKGSAYEWQELQDSEVAQALALANDALALAKNKNRVFTATPYTPYEVGDLWVQGSAGGIMRCKTTRLTGAYSSGDWELASKYTDDSNLNAFINGAYNDKVEDLMNQIDGKIETWFQTEDPALMWHTNEVRAKHIGDTWFDSEENTLRFYLRGNIQGITDLMSEDSIKFWKKNEFPSSSNAPTNQWVTSEVKDEHIGDIYYVPSSNNVYVYGKINDTYVWIEQEEDVAYYFYSISSLLKDGITLNKVEPSVPYGMHDLYFDELEVKAAITNNTDEEFVPEDWESHGELFYYWQQTKDKKAIEAYEAASKAQDTADGKRRVFVATPYPPYDVGDLWVDGTDLRRCATSRATGNYNVHDWVVAVNYDNTKTVIDGGIVTSGTVQLAGSNNSILAGITGEGTAAASIRIWAGASFENRASAPFRVAQNGNVVMENAKVSGEIHASSGTFNNGTFRNVSVFGTLRNPFTTPAGSFDINYNDNVALISTGGGWLNAYSLPWDVNQSGRRVTLVNYMFDGVTSQGYASISAPTGKYFYEDGIRVSTLQLSRQTVELMGYGTSSTFYGWIVLRRINIMTEYKYGRQLNALAQGFVTGTASSASIKYKTFDGSSLSVTRIEKGRYRVNFPSNWFSSADDYMVILTGVGYAVDNVTGPIGATLTSRLTGAFIVDTADDATRNDGSFSFMVVNMNDWT